MLETTTSRSFERNVPSNPDAEQAVLGALLLDPDAITRVAAFLRPSDFYLEKHAWIYETVLDLQEKREPVDFLSVVSDLEKREKLNAVGGSAYLTVLLNSVPTAAHVEHYAHLVEATSVQRQLLHASTEIAGLAYESADSLDEQISRAEQIIFDVANRRQMQEMIPIRRAVDGWIDRIDYLRDHQGETLGVQSGFADLDKVLGGLQKSDLIIVAGRPGSGKTSFALSICYHAAVLKHKRIAIFSLEMSAAQLVERLMAQVADVVASEMPGDYERLRVDSQSLRLGNISDDQWGVLARATGMLSEAEIYIDESSLVTPLEIRSKSRRLAAEAGGLDLIIVDYLQLMSDRGRSENRVQEMSNISRQLKFLAREVDVPVVALSQLSRAVESRVDKRPQLADLRESGCLAGETPVYLPDEGVYRRIDSLVGQSSFNILALNPETWQLELRRVLRAFPTGYKPVNRLTTRLGRTLRATANHQFLTIDGWRRLDELAVGTRIALPRQLPSPQNATMISDYLVERTSNTNRDVLPREVWRLDAVPAMQAAGITTRQLQAALGNAYCGTTLYKQNLGRERAARLAETVKSEEFSRLAQSDVYWDEIVAIEPEGDAEVYDLTVDSLHNFVAGDIVVHNSIEQDADIVVFIYREKVYYPTQDAWQRVHPNKPYPENLAEIIVAKHRHGPTTEFSMFFDEKRAKFKDLAVMPT